jgi:hypothetical protein
MEKVNFANSEKFSSPEEELSYLRQVVAEKEKQVLEQNNYKPDTEKVISQTLEQYKKHNPLEKLNKGHLVPEKMQEEIVLELAPETHDDKMAELIIMVETKGILNVLAIIEKMNDPHIQDDFHRFLVQYIKAGFGVKGLDEKNPLTKTLGRTLFEVTLPDYGGEDNSNIQELFALMEQFYSGMLSLNDEYLTLEVSNSIGSRQFIFYISVANKYKDLFEKQLLSIFTEAKIYEQKDDFNIFNERGYSIGAYAKFDSAPAKVIKTYEAFTNDPIKVILNVFSKLHIKDEAASIQFIFKPVGSFYIKNYHKAVSKLEKGEYAGDEMFIRNTFVSKTMKHISKAVQKIGNFGNSNEKKEGEGSPKIKANDLEAVKKKVESQVVSTNIRIITSAKTAPRAKEILHEIESAFNQFENTTGNKFKFDLFEGSKAGQLFKDFSYRQFNDNYDLPMNLKECATVFHLPSEQKDLSPQLKTLKSATAPAPLEISTEGILLGINNHRNLETEIYFSPEDRLRHFYTIGQTGTGKTVFMKNMILQDIKNGEGVCMIDPHGSDIQDVLAQIPPERYEDVIYFDPAHTARPMALNMLEYDIRFPEQKTFVVNELFSIFQKLYGGNPESMGPMFEQYFRNATMLVIEDPETGNTLLEVSRVMSDKAFRDLKLSRCKNPIVVQFWREIAEKAGGEASLANIVPYVVSKFDVFLANEIMRPVIAQEKSSFDFRKIMDEKKILLINLSKGRLGEINSSLIGLIVVGKILMAALSRVDSLDNKNMPPFYLYIDEFQNVTTNSISTILSEARKYKLSLNVAHQFIAQLDEKIRDSVFGNVGSMAVFRVGSEDAEFFEKQFSPSFSAKDIMNIDNFNCYLKMLVKGIPVKPFNIKTMAPNLGDKNKLESLKELSYLKYGRPFDEVNDEIMKKYEKPKVEKREYSDLNSLL